MTGIFDAGSRGLTPEGAGLGGEALCRGSLPQIGNLVIHPRPLWTRILKIRRSTLRYESGRSAFLNSPSLSFSSWSVGEISNSPRESSIPPSSRSRFEGIPA